MNEKIDVLAVMDDAIGDVMVAQASGLATDISVPEMCAARAAIAELIAAGELVAHERLGEGPAARWRNMGRFRHALANVGGAK